MLKCTLYEGKEVSKIKIGKFLGILRNVFATHMICVCSSFLRSIVLWHTFGEHPNRRGEVSLGVEASVAATPPQDMDKKIPTKRRFLAPTEPEEPLHTVPTLQCLATAPPSKARCNRTSQGRWVGGRWLGLGGGACAAPVSRRNGCTPQHAATDAACRHPSGMPPMRGGSSMQEAGGFFAGERGWFFLK